MLKGNLIVGKNQSVVLHAKSLQDLVRLAETKSQGALSLRVNLDEGNLQLDWLGDGISSVRSLPAVRSVASVNTTENI